MTLLGQDGMFNKVINLAKSFNGDLDKALQHADDYGVPKFLACQQCFERYKSVKVTHGGLCFGKCFI